MSNAALASAVKKATGRKPRTISVKAATSHVHKNLIRYRRDPLTPEYVGFTLDDVDQFAREVKSYLSDKSNLSTSTLDVANYQELLDHFRELADWKPKQKATVRKALENVHIEERPAPRRRAAAAVAVSVPQVKAVVKLPKEKAAKKAVSDRIVPANWRYMAEHADTPSARAWWTEYCNKRMRGEV